MGLAGAAVAERDDVLAALDIFTARQLHDQHLVERWDGLEVEAVEAFDGGEPGLPDPPLDHPAFAVDQFQFSEADEMAHMVGALGGALAGQLVVLAQKGRQLQGLEVQRRNRCALTEVGIRYWDHLPQLFDWPAADRDYQSCPFGDVYQLARNALAATLTPDGVLDPAGGHAVVVYDARNPEFHGNGRAKRQWELAVSACRVPGLVRRLSWQRLMTAAVHARELAYLVNDMRKKYGLEPG